MADATPSVRAMDTESRDLLDRMSNNDPRRGMVNRLLFKLADLIGGTAIATALAAMAAATAKLRGLPTSGEFKAIIAEADLASDAIAPPS